MSFIIFIMLLLSIIIFMSVILNFLFSRFVIVPVSVLCKAMDKVREGNLGERVNIPSEDEIGKMTSVFNDMSADLYKNQDALKNAEKNTAAFLKMQLKAFSRSMKAVFTAGTAV
ncbi:MAG: HAMP domain-containing protein [Desulfobacteraceae bacterium]|nr:HAMP domain-containing protein [Desulfobacteraceae bacterium]